MNNNIPTYFISIDNARVFRLFKKVNEIVYYWHIILNSWAKSVPFEIESELGFRRIPEIEAALFIPAAFHLTEKDLEKLNSNLKTTYERNPKIF